METRKSTTVFDHPTFVPSVVPSAPALQLRDGRRLQTLGEVLFLPLDDLRHISLAYLNLVCATLLVDTADLDIPACMKTFGEWTGFVRRETDRQLPEFRRKPSLYRDSEAYFRVLVMITALQRDLGVRYDPDCIKTPIFATSREGFIHGLLTGNRTGTCANMPVLYTAVGRALGYPIYLVEARNHLFCRWHSAKTGERFNIEASGKGLNVYPDDHYLRWPKPITAEEVRHGTYLRNLDPAEELGCFMATRGHCLIDKGHMLDAVVAYSHAHRLAPMSPSSITFLMAVINKEIDMRLDGSMPCTYFDAENYNRANYASLTCFVLEDRYAERVKVVRNELNERRDDLPA